MAARFAIAVVGVGVSQSIMTIPLDKYAGCFVGHAIWPLVGFVMTQRCA